MKLRLYALRWWIWFLAELLLPRCAIALWWSLEPRYNGRRRWM